MAIDKIVNIVSKFDDKGTDKAQQEFKKTEESSKDLSKQNKLTAKSTKGIGTAVKGVGTALKAIGIGIIIALFAKLADVFSQNQKVMDIFSNVTTTLSIAFNDLFSIFNDGLPSLDEIGSSIKKNIIERFQSSLEVVGYLGEAFKKLFEGDFAGAMDSAKEAGKEMVDVLTGVDGSLEKVTSYTEKIWEQAEATTALANASALAEVRLQGLIEKYDFQAEQQRQIRDDERLTIAERVEANNELGRVLDKQREAQLAQANISVASARAQIAATGANIENQVALQQALNEVAATEAQIAGFRSEQLINQASLEKELDEQRKERLEGQSGLADVSTDPKVLLAQSTADAMVQIETDKGIKLAELSEAELLVAQYTAEGKREALEGYASALTSISGVLGQETAAGKALAVASSLINTYAAITAQLKAAAGSPGAVIPGYAIAQAIATGAAGFASVKKILSVKVPNSGGGGGGNVGGAGGAVRAPSFNVVGNSGTSQLAQTINQDQDPVQAYVVGSDVTTQQEMDRNIVDTATIG